MARQQLTPPHVHGRASPGDRKGPTLSGLFFVLSVGLPAGMNAGRPHVAGGDTARTQPAIEWSAKPFPDTDYVVDIRPIAADDCFPGMATAPIEATCRGDNRYPDDLATSTLGAERVWQGNQKKGPTVSGLFLSDGAETQIVCSRRRRMPATATRPRPSSASVAGSGTAILLTDAMVQLLPWSVE